MFKQATRASSDLIPPPTVSGLLSPQPNSAGKPITIKDDDDAASLRRVQTSLEQRLQDLLDAQAAGLACNVGSKGAGSVNNNAPSWRASLYDARYGILSTISELYGIKETQLDNTNKSFSAISNLLDQTSGWQTQKQKLEDELKSWDSQNERGDLKPLLKQDQILQEQINAMEQKLSELRHQQGEIRVRISKLRNANASERSSFEASLSILNDEIKQFLRRPLPKELIRQGSALQNLPPKRRTIGMIIEQLQALQASLDHSRGSLRKEAEALKDGMTVWNEVVEVVESFEIHLKNATRALSKGCRADAQGELQEHTLGVLPQERPDGLFTHMNESLEVLQGSLRLSEEKGWTLLIAAVSYLLKAYRPQLHARLHGCVTRLGLGFWLTNACRLAQKLKHSAKVIRCSRGH